MVIDGHWKWQSLVAESAVVMVVGGDSL